MKREGLGALIDTVQALMALGLLAAGIWARWGWPYAAQTLGALLWADAIRRGHKNKGAKGGSVQ